VSEKEFGAENAERLEGRYSNYFEVGYNALEVVLQFGQFYADAGKPRYHTKIAMGPYYAKGLLETLQGSLEKYQQSYGAIVNAETEGQSTTGDAPGAGDASLGSYLAPLMSRSPNKAASAMAATNPIDDAIQSLLTTLRTYLPSPVSNVPSPSVYISQLNQRSLGLSNWRGEEERAGLGIVALKGGRLDAVVRVELWERKLPDVELALQDFIRRLLADRDKLWNGGFLRVGLDSISLSDSVASLNASRQSADFRVLYEYRFEDSDGTQGLIARIPIHINRQYNETTTVTDDMARWDQQQATPLVERGPTSVAGITCLLFETGQTPSGAVSLRRTFDGAIGPPTMCPNLGAFIAAVGGAKPAERHAELVFANWNSFIATFHPDGTPLLLDGDRYLPLRVMFIETIALPDGRDRLEIAYQHPAFEQNAVAYIRAV
jgi:hypothetical protein